MLDEGTRGPRWSFNRYAFGYSDKKPWGAMVIYALMIVYIAYRFWIGDV